MYWLSLAMIMASVISKIIRNMIFHFIWVGNMEQSKFHLSSWKSISLPNNLGGRWLKHLAQFNYALSLKSIWRGLFGEGLWRRFLKLEYIIFSIAQWIRCPQKTSTNASIIGRALTKSFPTIGEWLGWVIGRVHKYILALILLLGMMGVIYYLMVVWIRFQN